MSHLVDKAGGVEGIKRVLTTFYDAVFRDVMIGFFFAGINKKRLIAVETQLTARALGATEVAYTGQPLKAAHARHPIMGGHFERRQQLLREAMAKHDVDQEVQDAWLAHNEALRPLVTDDVGSDCDHDKAADRLKRLLGDS